MAIPFDTFSTSSLRTGFLAALLLTACGDDTDAAGEQQKATLDACGLPELCGTVVVTYGIEPSSARACLLKALEDGDPAQLSIEWRPDGGGHCFTQQEHYLLGDGTAFVWSREDLDCSDDPDDVDYRYTLERCTLKPPSHFAECRDADTTFGDPCAGGWYVDCVAAEPSCS
jgi:hypothetical protein